MNRHLIALARPVRTAQRQLFDCCGYLLSLVGPYRPLPGGKRLLNAEYADGLWSYLREIDEISRFSVVAGYCHYFANGGTILEIGCGEGILQERLCPGYYSRYVGIDISSQALTRTAARQCNSVSFIEADATEFVPTNSFDLIVFNECLEYFRNPPSLIRRYEDFLNPGGHFIVSMFKPRNTARPRKIWRALETGRYTIVASTTVSNQYGYSWLIKVLVPLAEP